MSEALFMVLIPAMFVRLGVKWMLAAGMFAWVLRYAFFAVGATDPIIWMIITGIALHGICYDFFFVTGQIYVDKKAPESIRGQAQGLIILITYGIGMLIGAQVAGQLYNLFLGEGSSLSLAQWHDFWWIPAIFAAAVMVFFIIFFNDQVLDEDATAEDRTV
jgi:dipeptide/tripeptide permease